MASVTVMVVAAVGIVVNSVTAWPFASARKGDLNLRAAFLHMAYDDSCRWASWLRAVSFY